MADTGTKLSAENLAASYGWALAFLKSDSSLWNLFNTAVKKQYTPERFAAELQSTSWFKNNSESMREYMVMRTTDPAKYVSNMKSVMASLADQYSQMTGEILPVNYPSNSGSTITEGTGFLASIADQSLKLGLNEAQIRDMLFQSIDWRNKISTHTLGGQAAGFLDSFRSTAAAYGVKPTDTWFAQKLGNVIVGNDSAEGVTSYLKEMAKQRYSHFAEDLDAGRTMDDIAENYRQSMAKVLEINPASIDLFDRQIQEGLKARPVEGATGQKAAMSITDFEDHLRRDDRWQFTDNAKETIMGQAKSVLEQFGLSA